MLDQGTSSSLDDSQICNPKRGSGQHAGRTYSYYAGYSEAFVASAIKGIFLRNGAIVLDPWNGAGTTTNLVSSLGFKAIGVDLNPVMNIVARGSRASKFLTSINEANKLLIPRKIKCEPNSSMDPLHEWFTEKTIEGLRNIIRKLTKTGEGFFDPSESNQISDAASLILICLFSILKSEYNKSPYKSSNPTWVKPISNPSERISIKSSDLERRIKRMLATYANTASPTSARGPEPRLILADSRDLPIGSDTIDAVITSPPYCTRIDYAIKMSIEHAIAFGKKDFDNLRRTLLGTTTVSKKIHSNALIGEYCRDLLRQIQTHESKASGTYYFKNITQYFDGLSSSIKEIARVLKPGGDCFIVVQDSRYKNIQICLDQAVKDMGLLNGLSEANSVTFSSKLTMSNINTASRRYENEHPESREHVLHLKKGAI